MEAIQASCLSFEQILEQKAKAIQKRFTQNPRSFGDLLVRKFSSRLEPVAFLIADSEIPFERARFKLVMSNTREEWRIKLDMVFHTRRRLLSDGSMADPGLQFNVVDEDGKSTFVEFISLEHIEELDAVACEEWVLFWLQKFIRKPAFGSVFAHKEFERELDY